jgi:hypothetical protein
MFPTALVRIAAVALSASVMLTGCIPYTVGSTARPTPRGERTSTMSTWVLPSLGDTTFGQSTSHLMIDYEMRWGIDDKSDAGFRATGGGIILNYKRLLSGPASIYDVAVMPGAGFVNLGNHAYFETTLMASKRPRTPSSPEEKKGPNVLPYFGLRVMQVAPLNSSAVHDRPTAGGFLGVRFGTTDFGVSPEIGVFYDHSALGVRKNDVVIVPAISVHGPELMRILRDIMRGAGPAFF